jgi:hypothetical protein
MRLTPRQRAFAQPPPATWTPAAGERVYLPRDGSVGSLVASGQVLLTVPPGWARVAVTYGRYRLVRIYRVRELRPAEPQTSAPGA